MNSMKIEPLSLIGKIIQKKDVPQHKLTVVLVEPDNLLCMCKVYEGEAYLGQVMIGLDNKNWQIINDDGSTTHIEVDEPNS